MNLTTAQVDGITVLEIIVQVHQFLPAISAGLVAHALLLPSTGDLMPETVGLVSDVTTSIAKSCGM